MLPLLVSSPGNLRLTEEENSKMNYNTKVDGEKLRNGKLNRKQNEETFWNPSMQGSMT